MARILAPHRVDTAATPAAALARVAAGYELVIADARPWPLDGFEVAADMQRRGLAVPVLLVTGADVIARVRQMADDLLLRNVSDVLAKPINRVDLEAAVARAVTASASERITRRALAMAVAPPRPRSA